MIVSSQHVIVQTADGYFLRFPLSDVPEKKRGAVGVRAIKLTVHLLALVLMQALYLNVKDRLRIDFYTAFFLQYAARRFLFSALISSMRAITFHHLHIL